MSPILNTKTSEPIMGLCATKATYELPPTADICVNKLKTTNHLPRHIHREDVTLQREPITCLDQISSKGDFPITMQIDSSDVLPDGLFTMNHKQMYTVLHGINELNKDTKLCAETSTDVKFLSVDNTVNYDTLAELRNHKKNASISWFVATKEFSVNQTTYYKGQIFTFAPQSLQHSMSRSFKRERQKGISVQIYPDMKRCFLPLCVEGDFRKCDPPSCSQHFSLCEISRSDNLPYFIFYNSTNEESNESCIYIYKRSTIDVLFLSQKVNGTLNLHAVSSSFPAKAKLTSSGYHVDVLDKQEIDSALKHFKIPTSVEQLENYYEVNDYKKLGVTRLLDEIFVELNQKIVNIGNNNDVNSSDVTSVDNTDHTKERTQNNDIEKTGPRKSSSMNFGPYVKVGNSKLNSSQQLEVGYLSGVDHLPKKTENCRQSCHTYINESPMCDQPRPMSRELIVQFDDGGYVVIPFFGRAPKISLDKETIDYKCGVNTTYGYSSIDELCEEKIEDPVYSYISRSALDLNEILDKPRPQNFFAFKKSEEVLEARLSLDDNKNMSNSKRMETLDTRNSLGNKNRSLRKYWELDCELDQKSLSRISTVSTATENRYSFSYDYPHMGYFRMPRDVGRQQITRLTIDEVADLLKINLMKPHIETFRQKQVNGPKLSTLTEEKLIDMHFTRFEARKLKCFVNGWRPLHGDAHDDLWLAKLPIDWSVFDLSRYLLHIDMRCLQRFASRHCIDGFLLMQLLKDDCFESIGIQHSILFRDQDVERLRKYVTEDGQTKFKFIRT